jgi:hypothetical protein
MTGHTHAALYRPELGARYRNKTNPTQCVEVRARSDVHTVATSDDGDIQLARRHEEFLRDWEPETPRAAAPRKQPKTEGRKNNG